MRRPLSPPRRTDWLGRAICGLALLGIACGAPAEAPRAAEAPVPLAPTGAAAPTAPSLQATAPTASVDAASAAPTATAGTEYKGIPVSRTPDGFHVLGAPEAPVTLTDYSDFL